MYYLRTYEKIIYGLMIVFCLLVVVEVVVKVFE